MAIVPVTFHVGEVGIDYESVVLGATGGTGAYQWSVGSGALPAGLTLSTDGHVTGAPTSAGNFDFTLHVADAGDATADAPATVRVAPALAASLVPACVSACSVELGCVTVCGPFGQLSGGVAPYTYTHTSGPLPNGTTLSGMALTGTFTGIPGYVQFTVLVTDKLGATASVSPGFRMFPHIAIAASAVCKGDYNTPCSVRIAYSGGTPGGTPKVKITAYGQYCSTSFCYPKPTSPPPSYKVTVGGGYVTVSVQAACGGACGGGYGGILYLNLTDQSQCASGTLCVSGTSALSIEIAGG